VRRPFNENTALNRVSLLSNIRNGEHFTTNHCFWLYAGNQRSIYYELRCRHCYCCDVYCGRNHVHAHNVSAVDSTPLFAHGYTRCKSPICSVTRSWVPKLCICQQYEAYDLGTFATLQKVVVSFVMCVYSLFHIFAVFWMSFSFFWVITRRLNFMCRHFGTLWCKQEEYICLSVLMEQLDSQWTDFRAIRHLRIVRKFIEQIWSSIKIYQE